MKKYTIGLITGALLAVSAMMFMGAMNKNLGDITVNSITVKDDGDGGFISISNSDGKERIYLGTDGLGDGILKIFNADGKKRIYLGNGTKGYGLYTLNNDRNRTGFFGSKHSSSYGVVLLYDGLDYGGVGWGRNGKQ